jgi:hypothetical protein
MLDRIPPWPDSLQVYIKPMFCGRIIPNGLLRDRRQFVPGKKNHQAAPMMLFGHYFPSASDDRFQQHYYLVCIHTLFPSQIGLILDVPGDRYERRVVVCWPFLSPVPGNTVICFVAHDQGGHFGPHWEAAAWALRRRTFFFFLFFLCCRHSGWVGGGPLVLPRRVPGLDRLPLDNSASCCLVRSPPIPGGWLFIGGSIENPSTRIVVVVVVVLLDRDSSPAERRGLLFFWCGSRHLIRTTVRTTCQCTVRAWARRRWSVVVPQRGGRGVRWDGPRSVIDSVDLWRLAVVVVFAIVVVGGGLSFRTGRPCFPLWNRPSRRPGGIEGRRG